MTGGSGRVGARVPVARRGGFGREGAEAAPCLPAVRRPAAPTSRRRRPNCRRSAWTAGARCAMGWKPGSTSASETLDAGRKVRCRRWRKSSLAVSIFGPETFARGSFLFALPVRAGAAASLGDVARRSAETLHHRW